MGSNVIWQSRFQDSKIPSEEFPKYGYGMQGCRAIGLIDLPRGRHTSIAMEETDSLENAMFKN